MNYSTERGRRSTFIHVLCRFHSGLQKKNLDLAELYNRDKTFTASRLP
jgi:hypothetical protein